jgi:DNA-binding IclR family transcriptional regulator
MRTGSYHIRIGAHVYIRSCANDTQLLPLTASHTTEAKLAFQKTAPNAQEGRSRPRAAADGSSRKVLRTLLAFSVERPRHSAESLAEHIKLPLSSTYRYLAILREAELIDEDGRGSFVLAPRVIGLAQAARSGTDLASIARPFMKRLAQDTGETVILIRRSGDRAICIERAESSSRIRLTFEVGTALPLHRGAAPKLLLAHLPDAECETTLDEAVARDPAFAQQRKAMMRELTIIREQGWAESRAEITPHVYAAAVGIVDATGVIAAISSVAPAFRTPRASQLKLREHLMEAAGEISKAYAAVTL